MLDLPEETEKLIALVARKTGKAPETVVLEAVQATARAAGVTPVRRKPSFERMMEISDRFAKHPVLDTRTPDDIVGYDEFGVPK